MRWTWTVGCAGLLLSASAAGQSEDLLTALRLHADGARAQAERELAACAGQEPPCEDRAGLALLTGFLQLSEGDARAAGVTLEATPAPKGLEPWRRYYLGQAAFYTRDYAGAAKHFAWVLRHAPASLKERARSRLGESLLAHGDAKRALPHLDAALKASPSAALFHQRAQARALTGDHRGEREDQVRLAVRYPTHVYGEAAEAALAAQKKPHRYTFEERMARAAAFERAGQAKRSLAELDALEAEGQVKGASRTARVSYERAQALYRLDRAGEAKALLQGLREAPRAWAARAAMYEARRALDQSRRDEARALLANVARTWPKEDPADEALYLAGWIDLQQGRFEEAVKTFAEFEEAFPRSRRQDEALWFKALSLLKLERHQEVAKTLNALMTRFPGSSLAPQARYWATRALQLGGAEAEGLKAGYERVISLFPGSFYALLSQVRLEELGVAPPPSFPKKPKALDAPPPKALGRALLLSATGLYADAREEIEVQLRAVRGTKEALVWGHALARLGNYGAAYWLAARHLWSLAYTDRDPEAIGLLYPRAFRTAVEEAAKEQAVPTWLVWAIMRRESAFRPEVSSSANARGLMQLIPPTARAIASRLGDEAPPPDALFAPEINIRYGTWYLSRLTERFAHPALVAAAYNAGPNAVLRWLKDDRALPLDLFVELIPYRETRGYVKQVVGDFYLYQALYGDGVKAKDVAMKLPEPKAEGVSF